MALHQVIPSHTIEANDMAADLRQEMFSQGLPINVNVMLSGPHSFEAVREMMAVAFGWESWTVLEEVLRSSHEPVHLDDNPSLLQAVVSRMSRHIGFDYDHGVVYKVIENSGTGYSPAARRALMEIATPWGPIEERIGIADGIERVSTSSHGGYILSEQRLQEIPKHLSNGTPYYEEDCEGRLVELAFPDLFPGAANFALAAIGIYSMGSVPRLRPTGTADEHFFSQVLAGYIPPDKDPMNRPLTDDERVAIEYLSQCVYKNKQPVVMPQDEEPSLQDWASALAASLKIDGNIPFRNQPWRTHFSIDE